jgi:PII-like signaling protein
MIKKVKHHSLGKLEIYIAPAHKVLHGTRSLFRKIFPKSTYMYLIQEARKDGIINAAAHTTHTSFTTDGKVISFSVEGDNSKLAMCVELVDKREKLEAFFLKHQDSLREKVVIFKEVEFWDVQ